MGLFKKKGKKDRKHKVESTRTRIGDSMSFAAKESYKVLRTNLMFMLKQDKNVVGITSSVTGEGKSLTSINLAIMFTEMGKKVLLIEGDMRKPVFQKYFNVKVKHGLSNVLAGHCGVMDAIFKSAKYENLYCIAAGAIPPNPSELLSSTEMEGLMATASETFDVVILDLPPVTAVTDATIASKFTRGVILVVRDAFVEKDELSETIRQLRIAEANILGFVYNQHDIGKNKYYKRGYKYTSYQDEYISKDTENE